MYRKFYSTYLVLLLGNSFKKNLFGCHTSLHSLVYISRNYYFCCSKNNEWQCSMPKGPFSISPSQLSPLQQKQVAISPPWPMHFFMYTSLYLQLILSNAKSEQCMYLHTYCPLFFLKELILHICICTYMCKHKLCFTQRIKYQFIIFIRFLCYSLLYIPTYC
jgi:hypothetical protein